jgi:hypothetical protein
MSDVKEKALKGELGDELGDEKDAEELGEDEEIDAEEFDTALDEEYDGEVQVAEAELSPKEQNARSLAIRKAIEQRMERKQLDEDLDYLDLDLDEQL